MQVPIYLIIWTRHSLLAKNNDNFLNRQFKCPYSLIHFRARFYIGEGRGGSSPRWIRNTSRSTTAFPPMQQQDLPRQCFLSDSGHMAEPITWDLSIRRSGVIFRALRISSLCILSRSVTPWTLRKNPNFAACSWESILSVVNRGS